MSPSSPSRNLFPAHVRRRCEVVMKRLWLVKEYARDRDKHTYLKIGNRPTLPHCGKEGAVLNEWHSRKVKRL